MARNSFLNCLRNKFSAPSKDKNRNRREKTRRRPGLESLERRELFAGLVDQIMPVEFDADSYFQDFGNGLPAAEQGWEYHSTNKGRIQTTDERLQMDATDFRNGYSLNEAILHLDLEGRSGVELTLDHDSIYDENTAMPSSYTGHHNSDGIAFSNDGEKWHRLTSLSSDFDEETFDLDAAVTDAGIEYTSDFQIKFQQYDNFYANWDGRAFDDIRIDVAPLNDSAESVTEVVYQETFDSAAGANWTFNSTAKGRIQTDGGRLEMDSSQRRVNSLNEAVLQLDLHGRTGVTLQFDHDNTSDENRRMPASFTGSHNSDGVAISSDGATWHRLTSLTSDFSGKSFDLDAAIESAGIEYTSDFQIKFQQYDNYPMPIDGRAIDNVVVMADVPSNTAPVGVEDTYTVNEDDTLTVDAANGVLANDQDAEGDSLTAAIVTGPENGQLTLQADGSFVYVPNADFHGSDAFTYTASDGELRSAAVAVQITIDSVNDAPVAHADVVTTDEDQAITIDVLENDVDVEANALSVAIVEPPANGTVEVSGGAILFTPATDYFGTDSFTYAAVDSEGASSTASVEITVSSVFDPPAWVTTEEQKAEVMNAIGAITTDASKVILSPSTNQSRALIGLNTVTTNPTFNGIDGTGFSTVIIDTGIDVDHPFFGPDGNGDGVADRIVFQWDFAGTGADSDGDGIVDQDNDASDNDDHGSNVASIVASQGQLVSGILTNLGVAPGANIIALKVFEDGGDGNFGYTELALQWVVNNAAAFNIASVNMSLGDSGFYTNETRKYGIDDELKALAAMNVIVVSATGNDYDNGAGFDKVGIAYPAADPNSLAVGAVYDANVGSQTYGHNNAAGTFIPDGTDVTTAADRITVFSQRHPELVDVFAPGAPIVGAGATGGTVTQSGTSQASPHVAGVALLAQQYVTQNYGQRLDLAEFRSLLRATGVTINDGDDEDDRRTDSTGKLVPIKNTGEDYKRLDANALMTVLAAPLSAGPETVRPKTTLYHGDSVTSSDGRFRLAFEEDGNLVLRLLANGKELWSSGTAGSQANRVVMQGDGNLVIYSDGNLAINGNSTPATITVWASDSDSEVRRQADRQAWSTLTLQNDGNLVLRSNNGTVVWASNTDWANAPNNVIAGVAIDQQHFVLTQDGKITRLSATSGREHVGGGMLGPEDRFVSLAATKSQLYALHASGTIYKFAGNAHQWEDVGGGLDARDNFLEIAGVGADLFALHQSGEVYRLKQTHDWERLGGGLSTGDAFVSLVENGGELYALHDNGFVYRYEGEPDSWRRIGGGLSGTDKIVALSKAGNDVFMLHQSGDVYRYTGQPDQWDKVGGGLHDGDKFVAVAAIGSEMFALHQEGKVYRYDGRPNHWQRIGGGIGASDSFISLVTVQNELVVLHEQGGVYRFKGHPDEWERIGGQTSDADQMVGMETSGRSLFTLHGDGTIYRYQGAPDSWERVAGGSNDRFVQLSLDGNTLVGRHQNGNDFLLTGSPDRRILDDGSSLVVGGALSRGQSIQSPNGQFSLTLQRDGLVLYYNATNEPMWRMESDGRDATRAILKYDGRLALLSGNAEVISRAGSYGAKLTLQDDANLVLRHADGRVIWATGTEWASRISDAPNKLIMGEELNRGEAIVSANRRFELLLRHDGDLVLRERSSGAVMWRTGTANRGIERARLHSDGRFILYKDVNGIAGPVGSPVGSPVLPKAQGAAGASLVVQDDGNFVAYGRDGHALDASNTFYHSVNLREEVTVGGAKYGLHQNGSVYRIHSSSNWEHIGGHGSSDTFVGLTGAGNNLFVVHQNGRVYRFRGTAHKWEHIGGGGNSADKFTGVAGVGGNLFVMHRDGKLYRYRGTAHNWVHIGGGGSSVDRFTGIATLSGNLFVMHRDGRLYRYEGTPHRWQHIGGGGSSSDRFTSIHAFRGSLVVLHNSGKIYRYEGRPHRWQRVGGGLSGVDKFVSLFRVGSDLMARHANGTTYVYGGSRDRWL